MASYDRIDWHSGGDFPENLPHENGGTHIGMYLTWIIENNLIGELHTEESKEGITKVHNKEWTGRDFLINMCDEKFWEEDLSEEGNDFTKYYYNPEEENKLSYYLVDYLEILGQEVDSLYEIENSWDNYDKLKPIIDKRYMSWKKQNSKKPFWKLW